MQLPVYVLSDFNTEMFGQALMASTHDEECRVAYGQIGPVQPALIEPPEDINEDDIAILWTTLSTISPEMARASLFEDIDHERILNEVSAFADLVAAFSETRRAILMPTWTSSPISRGYGVLDRRPGLGLADVTARSNLLMADRLADCPNVFLLDSQRWLSIAGMRSMPPKMWYAAKIPFGMSFFETAAADVKAALAALVGQSRRLIIVDLDDTLWGGVVGEVGWENLVLGGHHIEGEAFQDFQKHLKALTHRGIQIAIASKNTEAVALEAIDKNPEMALERNDITAWRINWDDKAANVLKILKEVNLGPQSAVFIDDSPAERARIKEAFPEILVPDWPSDPTEYVTALEALACFDQAAITSEDRTRTGNYQAELLRRASREEAPSIKDWLAKADITVTVQLLSDAHRSRAAQLFNKTNQMNSATRRLSENEISAWVAKSGRHLWTAHISDRFGDYGLSAIVSMEISEGCAEIVDFLLSCRVMGRYVEEALVSVAVGKALQLGAAEVRTQFMPTTRNLPMLSFWQGSGFEEREPGLFSWSCERPFPRPAAVTILADEIDEKPVDGAHLAEKG